RDVMLTAISGIPKVLPALSGNSMSAATAEKKRAEDQIEAMAAKLKGATDETFSDLSSFLTGYDRGATDTTQGQQNKLLSSIEAPAIRIEKPKPAPQSQPTDWDYKAKLFRRILP